MKTANGRKIARDTHYACLAHKLRRQEATIAIIGLGYVGLPLAVAFAHAGLKVTGIDLDPRKVQRINEGKSYIEDVPSTQIKTALKSKRLRASSDFECLKDADVAIICVPTPLNQMRDPDMSFIMSASEAIARSLHRGQLIILESTTYPGTTDEVVLPLFERGGLRVGTDFFLCFSPERVDPGNSMFKTGNIPKVVGGITRKCGELGSLLYSNVTSKVVTVSSTRNAEMAKLLENTFRIVNIGLINELAVAAQNLKIDIWEAIDAAKTKPFGFMPFYPGPGVGGHCIGIDPLYLSWKAKIHGSDLHFIELARRVNSQMPDYVVSQAVAALNRHAAKAISRSRILILGVSYKRDVADYRESPSFAIIDKLRKFGAIVSYHDPFVPGLNHEGIRMCSSKLRSGFLRKQDLVIVATDHTKVDYRLVVKHSRLIFDTRNILRQFKNPNIVRL
jgi:UDP-N-acetyl-D-glucosamine dehydrogenase